MARAASIPHLPALDGLRGLAVIGVLFFHAGYLKGGYLGVDLFFVLSGYLITSLLLAEHRASHSIDLKAFWIRRARRLLPAALFTVALVAAYAVLFAAPVDVARIRADGLATLGYVANWHAIVAGQSYWALFAAPSPLEHTWSLAIEEQFYVLWPLLVFWVLRVFKGSSRVLLGICATLALLSAVAMVVLYYPESTSRAYLGTDSRGGSILMGAALACLRPPNQPLDSLRAIRLFDGLGLLALAGLAVAWTYLEGSDALLYHGGFWLTEGLVALLIVCAAQGKKSVVARLFALKPLVWMGLISYGVYLYHWPIFVLLTKERLGLDGWSLTLARFAATLGMALLSYYLLEQPIRKKGLPFGKPWLVVPSSFVLVTLALLAGTREKPVVAPAEPVAAPGAYPFRPAKDFPPQELLRKGTVKVLVVGDSVAIALGDKLRAVEDGGVAVVAQRGVGDCSILEGTLPTKSLTNTPHDGGDCAAHWSSDAAELHPDVTLVVLGGGFFAPVQVEEKWQRPCEQGWNRAYGAEVEKELLALGPAAGKVVMVKVPYPVGNWTGAAPHDRVDCFNATLLEASARVGAVSTLDLLAELCPQGNCALESEGAAIRPDGLHFLGPGADAIARWVRDQVVALAVASSK